MKMKRCQLGVKAGCKVYNVLPIENNIYVHI